MWEPQNIPPKYSEISSVKHALKLVTVRRYEDKWQNDVKHAEKHPVLRTYIKFQENFGI